MSRKDITIKAAERKRALGVYALFDCERRPSAAFIRAINAARRYPFPIETPIRLIEAARDRKRRS